MAATAADPHKKPRHQILVAWQTSRGLQVACNQKSCTPVMSPWLFLT